MRNSVCLQPDVPITLEVLHLVFSAFGFVHKIATFEKQAGLQALVQFDDAPTAEMVSADRLCAFAQAHSRDSSSFLSECMLASQHRA